MGAHSLVGAQAGHQVYWEECGEVAGRESTLNRILDVTR